MLSGPDARLRRIESQINSLRDELTELSVRTSDWNYKSPVYGKRYRTLAERLVLSAKRLEVLVREHSQVK